MVTFLKAQKCSANKLCWNSVISIKLLYNFIEIALRHGFSPVNLVHIFRTPFLKNTSEWLLLILCVWLGSECAFAPRKFTKKGEIYMQFIRKLRSTADSCSCKTIKIKIHVRTWFVYSEVVFRRWYIEKLFETISHISHESTIWGSVY